MNSVRIDNYFSAYCTRITHLFVMLHSDVEESISIRGNDRNRCAYIIHGGRSKPNQKSLYTHTLLCCCLHPSPPIPKYPIWYDVDFQLDFLFHFARRLLYRRSSIYTSPYWRAHHRNRDKRWRVFERGTSKGGPWMYERGTRTASLGRLLSRHEADEKEPEKAKEKDEEK